MFYDDDWKENKRFNEASSMKNIVAQGDVFYVLIQAYVPIIAYKVPFCDITLLYATKHEGGDGKRTLE